MKYLIVTALEHTIQCLGIEFVHMVEPMSICVYRNHFRIFPFNSHAIRVDLY